MSQTFAHRRFNCSVIKNLVGQLKGKMPDDDFIQIWQSWVGIREENYGTYSNLMKKDDFEKLIKISKGDREKAFDLLVFLIHLGHEKFDRITSEVAKEYAKRKHYEWE